MMLVINLNEHQWLVMLGVALMSSVITWAITRPRSELRGYERRSREKAEERPDLAWLKVHRERKEGESPCR